MAADPRWPGLTGDQLDIASTVADYLSVHSGPEAVRAAIATTSGIDETTWRGLVELGVPGLTVAPEHGGLGLGATELALVLSAAGAILACVPLLSSVVLATTLLQGTGEPGASLLGELASGARRATVALGEPNGLTVTPTVHATSGAGGWALDGTVRLVLDGHTADAVLVLASTVDGPALFAVDGAASGLRREPMRTLDLTRPAAVLTFAGAAARPLLTGPTVLSTVDEVLDVARVMLAAEQVGGAQRCLSTAVAYAQVRTQFDRIIGSFQAIKHTCANMLITVESARATLVDAVRAAEQEPDRLAAAASLAKAVCSDGYFQVASDALHVHGGIGFTWEHESHLSFRRAKSDQLLFGSPADHLDRVLTLSGLVTVRSGSVGPSLPEVSHA